MNGIIKSALAATASAVIYLALIAGPRLALAQCGPTGSINCRAVISDYQSAKTGAYNLAAADCNSRLLLGGATFYAVSATNSYPAGCKIWLTNTDPIPTSLGTGYAPSPATGAKFINFVSCYPGEGGHLPLATADHGGNLYGSRRLHANGLSAPVARAVLRLRVVSIRYRA
jgi:hypothetical protein